MGKRLFLVFSTAFLVAIFFFSTFTTAIPSNGKGQPLLSDSFKGAQIDTSKWMTNLGFEGSSITQNKALYLKDMSLYPTSTSVKSIGVFSLAVFEVDICMFSPSQFWSQVQVMLTESTTNQYGNNVQEVFMRKANVYWNGATWVSIPDTTADSICISYQSRYGGNWGGEVVIAKNLTENTWYHVKIENTASLVTIQVFNSTGIIGTTTSTRQPLNTALHFYLGVDCESTSYALTGAFDNVKISALKK